MSFHSGLCPASFSCNTCIKSLSASCSVPTQQGPNHPQRQQWWLILSGSLPVVRLSHCCSCIPMRQWWLWSSFSEHAPILPILPQLLVLLLKIVICAFSSHLSSGTSVHGVATSISLSALAHLLLHSLFSDISYPEFIVINHHGTLRYIAYSLTNRRKIYKD